MQAPISHNLFMIVPMLLLMLLLAVWPMGQWSMLRPEWVVLLSVYWLLALPYRLGLGVLCVIGLLQDLIEGSLLGHHALALVLIGYVCLLSYQRIRNYAIWQQAIWVFVLVGVHQLIGNWISSLSGHESRGLSFLLPALSSALFWPLIYRSQLWLRLRYQIS